jgi:hypothetical protein
LPPNIEAPNVDANPNGGDFVPKAPKGLCEPFLLPRFPKGDVDDPESAPNLELANRLAELLPDPKILGPDAAVAKGDLLEVFAKPLFCGN